LEKMGTGPNKETELASNGNDSKLPLKADDV
jgi:hypothetical protein